MAGCDIRRAHGLRSRMKSTELKWVCPDCLEVLESPESATRVDVVEVERKRRVFPLVMPVAGLMALVAIVSEVLFYWH